MAKLCRDVACRVSRHWFHNIYLIYSTIQYSKLQGKRGDAARHVSTKKNTANINAKHTTIAKPGRDVACRVSRQQNSRYPFDYQHNTLSKITRRKGRRGTPRLYENYIIPQIIHLHLSPQTARFQCLTVKLHPGNFFSFNRDNFSSFTTQENAPKPLTKASEFCIFVTDARQDNESTRNKNTNH